MKLPRVAIKTRAGLVIISDKRTHAELLTQLHADGILLRRVSALGWYGAGGFREAPVLAIFHGRAPAGLVGLEASGAGNEPPAPARPARPPAGRSEFWGAIGKGQRRRPEAWPASHHRPAPAPARPPAAAWPPAGIKIIKAGSKSKIAGD